MEQLTLEEASEEYKAFVDKFKPKLTRQREERRFWGLLPAIGEGSSRKSSGRKSSA